VVRRDLILAEALPQLMGHPLRHPPRVHEHEGGAVALHVLRDGVEDLTHLLR
jgi:hypothetical protein